ncbi:hypothetical protein [Mucilaginibacter sp.]|uniref:hypothetical protein n=1 Tax=Mucilaginibacter sp. TaxID=1882438 RepID=UPI00284AA120|nr:hypothetical protein [Mucilaginibacter sp.]MDR3696024.1 hypothetical protein [Mucilaginibacter sp.]
MKKHIIITLILLLATAYVTVVYFKNLNPPGSNTSRVMRTIPGNASIIFEFNNDSSFYDIFKGNPLFATVTGRQVLGQLDTLRQQLLQNQLLSKYFSGQNVFISVHPTQTRNIELLITLSASNGFGPAVIDQLVKQPGSGLLITPLKAGTKEGYTFYINALKKRFYLISNDHNIYSGSFSKELINEVSANKKTDTAPSFALLSEQQNANSLANVYVNYSQLDALFDCLFSNKNTDIFKSFRLLSGHSALSLNYKTDALMFNGETTVQVNEAISYLNLFANQQPVNNQLKDIFPSTTAYSTNLAVSDPLGFSKDLSGWYTKAGLKKEERQLFNKIQAETGTDLKKRFYNLLGNEFAIVTTRYFEKLAIISLKDGSKMNTLLMNVSKITDENSGQLSYDKLPFFLLGDAFSIFRHPYYLIIDNYLILANSINELKSYDDSYLNRKFLSKNQQYGQFDNLLSAQSNVTFMLIFKNAEQILKRDMEPEDFNSFQKQESGWKNFYGISWQLSAAKKNYYTNFCLKLNTDTVLVKN